MDAQKPRISWLTPLFAALGSAAILMVAACGHGHEHDTASAESSESSESAESLKLDIDTPDVGGFQTPFGEYAFVCMEKWESLDALMAHAVSPHMKAYSKATKDMVADRVIHVLSPA